jgi:enterochelin esterase-like enzyme
LNGLCYTDSAGLFLFLALMSDEKISVIKVDHHLIHSANLDRVVKIDCYLPPAFTLLNEVDLLLVNDGQDLVTMGFEHILDELVSANQLSPLICVGIHCSADRKNEYGTANLLDYKGRGAKAFLYTTFVFEELMPFLRQNYPALTFREKAFAGFSLGGLSALDIVWNYPHEFTKAGVFSGSFWWRDKDQLDADFDENVNRIMHKQVKEGAFASWLKFYFEVGTKDETADRNNNGVIDAIDDTVSLINELVKKGYHQDNAIRYLELEDGRHDVPTWAKAFPDFLRWGWGRNGSIGQ